VGRGAYDWSPARGRATHLRFALASEQSSAHRRPSPMRRVEAVLSATCPGRSSPTALPGKFDRLPRLRLGSVRGRLPPPRPSQWRSPGRSSRPPPPIREWRHRPRVSTSLPTVPARKAAHEPQLCSDRARPPPSPISSSSQPYSCRTGVLRRGIPRTIFRSGYFGLSSGVGFPINSRT
jgi:hypothetical protein